MESVFEYVKETVDQGDSITCRTVDNLEVDIPKSELTSGEVKCLTDGCFTGDTLVRTSQGLKRIDSIQEGELVLSKNTKTGAIGYKPVLYVYRKSTTNFINLIVEGELIETTPTHLFMLEKGNWRAAENLKSGDRILTADGEIKTVDEIQVISYDKARPIFNLNVDEYHTYFITGLALLVHNDCNEITTDFIIGNSTDYLEQLKIKSQVVINHEVGAAFENYVEGTKLAHVDYDIQELYGILDKSTGDIVQVKPDFTMKSLTTGEKVAFADAKTALTGRIPHDDQFERLVWLTEQETITGTLIYYVPSAGNYISDDMIRYANQHGVRILQVVAE
jgi:intein/homing endonuclease